MLGQAHNIASAGLTDLETAARSVNGSIGNALDFANSTAVLNGNILKELGELASLIPGSDLVLPSPDCRLKTQIIRN